MGLRTKDEGLLSDGDVYESDAGSAVGGAVDAENGGSIGYWVTSDGRDRLVSTVPS